MISLRVWSGHNKTRTYQLLEKVIGDIWVLNFFKVLLTKTSQRSSNFHLMITLKSVHLKNFRCHSDLKLDIPTGLVQFKGDSGSGKSSVAAGISYGLFGKVWRTKNLVSYSGEKSFSVTLELSSSKSNYKITRINSPKTLKIRKNGKLVASGDQAEEILSRLIGITFPQYVWGVSLKSDFSILEASPQEKYEAVCSLAGVIKEDISEQISVINSFISESETRLKVLNQKKSRLEGVIKTLKNEKVNSEENLPDPAITKDKVILKTKDIEEEELESTLNRLEEIDQLLNNFGDSETASIEKQITITESKLASVMITLDETEGYDENFIEATKLINEVRKIRIELSETEQEVKASGAKRKKEILEFYDENLPKDVGPSEYRNYVANLRDRWSTYEKLKSERDQISKSKKNSQEAMLKIFKLVASNWPQDSDKTKNTKSVLSLLASKKLKLLPKFVCPCCSSRLAMKEEKLISYEDEEDDDENISTVDIETIDQWVTRLKELQPLATREIPEEPTKPRSVLTKAEELLETIEIKQGEIRSIDTGSSPLISRVRSRLAKLEKLASKIEYEIETDEVDDDIILEYSNLNKKRLDAIKSKKTLEKNLEKLQKKLEGLSSMESLLSEASTLRERKEVLDTNKRKREEIEKSNKIIENYENLVSRLDTSKKQLKKVISSIEKLENEIIGLKGLKIKIKEAMLLSIEETIININEESKKFMDQLFSDGPSEGLKVHLALSEKLEGKITVSVIRPGGENQEEIEGKYDDLSDGEKQRTRLAFFLGVNEYLDSNLRLIMIDEALNQVEESLNTKSINIVKSVRGVRGQGTQIIISHEAISGQFDEIIDF